MDGRTFVPLLVSLLCVTPCVATAPVKLSPVLPEVTRHLQEGLADMENNTPLMARAHARLILLDNHVKFSINFENVPEKDRNDCRTCLRSALGEWEKDLGGSIAFVSSSSKEVPMLVVRFRPAVSMGKEQVAGYVTWSRKVVAQTDGSVMPRFNANLQLRVHDLLGNRMPNDAMRHAAMHELGHVLGLDDSPNEGDVMGPLDIDHPVAAPTSLEIETVKSLRAQATEILDRSTSVGTR